MRFTFKDGGLLILHSKFSISTFWKRIFVWFVIDYIYRSDLKGFRYKKIIFYFFRCFMLDINNELFYIYPSWFWISSFLTARRGIYKITCTKYPSGTCFSSLGTDQKGIYKITCTKYPSCTCFSSLGTDQRGIYKITCAEYPS